jgi:plasmid replication initiation protein
MTSLIQMNDKDFKIYNIDVQDIKNFFGIENEGSVYSYIKDSVRSLMDKKIVITEKMADGKTKETTIPMVIEMSRIIEDKSSISLSFHPKMKPYLLDLKNRFLSYDVENVLKLSSSYSIRIYELTKANVGLGRRVFSVDELKKILGITDKYKQYSHLKQRVLEPSKENINRDTDITIDYKEVKKGRSIVKLIFSIERKKTEQPTDDLAELLQKQGVSKSTIKSWRKKYSNEHIIEKVEYMLAKHKISAIQNKGGYLNSIMDKDLQAKETMSKEDITKRVNAILFSRPNLQGQIEAKHGSLSQEAINKVVKSMFPDRFLKK